MAKKKINTVATNPNTKQTKAELVAELNELKTELRRRIEEEEREINLQKAKDLLKKAGFEIMSELHDYGQTTITALYYKGELIYRGYPEDLNNKGE